MAATVLGIAGAVVGGFFGMPALGWAIGSALGGALFPETNELPDVYGPRLGDSKIQGASYGAALGRVYGTIRKSGGVIWSTPKIEHISVQTVESGGKGGGGSEQTQTTYSYTRSFAVAICETEIFGIRKIWANGELIYNVSDGAVTGGTLISSSGIPITVYPGDEAQLPDPIMESFLGAGNVPGYRGTAYAVFNDLQLAPYGNNIPNLEFEVVSSGDAFGPTERLIYTPPGSPSPAGSLAGMLSANGLMWVYAPSLTPGTIYLVDLNTSTLLLTYTPASIDRFIPLYIDSSDSVWGWNYAGGTQNTGLWQLTTAGVATKYTMSASVFGSGTRRWGFDDQGNPYVTGFTGANVIWKLSNFNHTLDTVTLTQLTSPFNAVTLWINPDVIPGRMYAGGATNVGVQGFGYYQTDSGVFNLVKSFDTTGFTGRAGIVDPNGFLYLPDPSNIANIISIIKYDLEGNQLAACSIAAGNTAVFSMTLDHTGNLWVAGSVTSIRRLFQIDTLTMTLQNTITIADHELAMGQDLNGNSAVTFDITSGAFKVYTINGISTISSNVADLSAIVTAECALVGLSGSDIDVSDLSGIEVNGYLIGGRGPVRNAIQPLMPVFFFDAVESDGKIKFVTRGNASAVTIPEAVLGAYSGSVDPSVDTVAPTRKQETEVPAEITVKYYDRDRDYQEGAQVSKRQTSLADEKLTISMPIALNSDEGRSNADALMFMAQMSRTSIAFTTSRAYAKYEPSDVVTLQKGVNDYLVRITRRDEGVGGVIAWESELEDPSVYTQATPGAAGIPSAGSVRYPGSTVLTFLDIPMLRDSDDDPGLYTAAYGPETDWRGMQLYQSKDSGSSYQALPDELQLSESTVGRASTALAMFGTVETNELFDEVNTVTVVLDSGELETITRNEVLAGGNYAALKSGTGWEIIQFKTATLTAADIYALSGLLRGRLGTEWAMSGHIIGDRFVLLDIDSIREFPLSFTDLNLSYYYKAVSIGNSLAGTPQIIASSTGVRVKPLAPWHLAGGRTETGDLVIQWVPRTRTPVIDWGLASDPPSAETSELYSIDIMNGSSVARTLSSSTQTVTYTAADQTTDFGSPQASVAVKVYQVSTEFGRGYPVTGTL